MMLQARFRLLSFLALLVAVHANFTPTKNEEIDLNASPAASNESSGLAYHPGSTSKRSEEITPDKDSRGRIKRIRRKYGMENQHYRRYMLHREVALQLRDKSIKTMSKKERDQLRKTREYLRHKVYHCEKRGTNEKLVEEAKDLLEHLQGGNWRLYKGLMGADEIWRKSESERVVRGQKKRQALIEEGIPRPVIKRKTTRIPDDEITPEQLMRRKHNQQYIANQKTIRMRQFNSKGLNVVSLQAGLPGWENRKQRTPTYHVL